MSQTFVGDTRVVTTSIKTSPSVVTQVKSIEKDGYWAVQIGFGDRKIKNTTKPLRGHLKGALKNEKTAPHFLKEIRYAKKPDLKVGDAVKVSEVFKKGDLVSVMGTSKGKGFAGVVKRWGFAGGPRTHGQSDRQRAPGSIGQGTDPGRVWKGKKMGGRMGTDQVTVKNLLVVSIDEEKGLMNVSGPIPGPTSGYVLVRKIGKGKLTDLIEEKKQVEVQKEPEEEKKEEAKSKEN